MLASASFLLLVLCNLAHNLSAQKTLPLKNAKVRDKVVLQPAFESGKKIKDVTWKHNGDIAVEWFGDRVTSYREFIGRTTLDTTSGVLTINDLIPELKGTYTAEINNQIISSQEVKVYDPVPKPTVRRTAVENVNSYVFTCVYNVSENAKPVKLKWKIDDVEQPDLQLPTVQGSGNCSFVCELSNPVSNQFSEVVENPSCKDSSGPGAVIGIVIVVLILVILVFLLLVYVICVKKPPMFKDNTIITALQNSPFGKSVDRCYSTMTGKKDGAAARGKRSDGKLEQASMIDNTLPESSGKPGANGTPDKQKD